VSHSLTMLMRSCFINRKVNDATLISCEDRSTEDYSAVIQLKLAILLKIKQAKGGEQRKSYK